MLARVSVRKLFDVPLSEQEGFGQVVVYFFLPTTSVAWETEVWGCWAHTLQQAFPKNISMKSRVKKQSHDSDDESVFEWEFSDTSCNYCGIDSKKIGGALMNCFRCKMAYYCSCKCMNDDLQRHSFFCKAGVAVAGGREPFREVKQIIESSAIDSDSESEESVYEHCDEEPGECESLSSSSDDTSVDSIATPEPGTDSMTTLEFEKGNSHEECISDIDDGSFSDSSFDETVSSDDEDWKSEEKFGQGREHTNDSQVFELIVRDDEDKPQRVYGTYKELQLLQKQELEKIQLRESETVKRSIESKNPDWINIRLRPTKRHDKVSNLPAVNYKVPWQGRANLKVTDRGDKLKRLGSIRKGLMSATPATSLL